MAESTYRFLALLGESGITNWTCVLLLVMFAYGLWDKQRFGRVAPGLMTSLGILGTFCGIYLSLYPLDFTPGNMNNSVTQLLGGMRTAFFTSLAGIGSSILFRIIERIRAPRNIDDTIKKQMTPEQQLVIDKLESIRRAIAGDEDSSLVTQIQYIRNENRDAIKKLDQLTESIQNALIASLNDLIREVREVIAKQLKDSIEALISRIEKALIDQFGKTFIEFNQATQAIRKWQEENRLHVHQLTRAFELSARGIERIAKNCESIPATMESLSEIMKAVNREVNTLHGLLDSFAKLGEQAEKSFPLIKQNLDKIGMDLANSARGFSDLRKELQTIFEEAQESLKSIAEEHLRNVDQVAKSMTQTMKEESAKSSLHVQDLVRKTLKEFGENIASEANAVARGFGQNMLSIAEKCAKMIEQSEKGGNHHG